ncbi:MAG: heavy metal-binding domain-containing protein [Pyrinomonadaceae bacterium]
MRCLGVRKTIHVHACDEQVYDKPGECPVCGMGLVPKYTRANTMKRPAA